MIVSVTVTDSREDQIADAVRSVVDQVDRVLLVDTGVTDGTIDRAREVAGAKLLVVRSQWSNDFSVARNAGLSSARDSRAQWAVIVDSDERINWDSLDLRKTLKTVKTDVDALFIESDDGHYPKEKIVRLSSDAHFFGPTHEALLGTRRRELLRGPVFRELPKKPEELKRKFDRDVRILDDFIKQHPGDARWWYYFGVSLDGLGEHERAANAFTECARLRKTGHEAAWSYFKAAEQFLQLKRYDEAIKSAALGLGVDATFAECACVAAEAALNAGNKTQAVAWARMAEATGRFKGVATERLWFRDLVSLYERPYCVLNAALPDTSSRGKARLDYEAARLARVYAIDSIKKRDLDWMSVSRSVPAPNREEARAMLRPPPLGAVCQSAQATQIQFEPPGGRLPMNPSICRHNGKIWCVIRAVNYTLNGRAYTIHDPHGVVRTENYLAQLTLDGGLLGPVLMRDFDVSSPRYASQIVGYEDIRLFSINGLLSGSATVCDRDPNGRRLIARLHLDALGHNIKRADVQPSNQPHEKNWMPLVVRGKIVWIYSLDPTAVLPGPMRQCSFALDHLRGGAAIPYDNGYLCVTHETIDTVERRIYLHRFVKLDKQWNVTAVSSSWVFAHHGIEFCAGMLRDRGRIVLSYGIEDREAWIMKIDIEEIEAMKWITP